MPEILDLTYAYRKLMVVDTACELGVFTRLEERAQTAEELAERTGAQPLPLKAMLDVCVGLGLLRLERVVRGYFAGPEGNQNPFGALFDLARLFWGEERESMPLARVVDWLGEAGFADVHSFPLTERSMCIVATSSGGQP